MLQFWKLSTAWKHLICFGISQIPVKLWFAYYTLTSGRQPRSISTGILINFQLEKNNNPANQQTFFLRALTPHFTSVCTQLFELKWEHKQDLRIYQEQSSSWHWPRITHNWISQKGKRLLPGDTYFLKAWELNFLQDSVHEMLKHKNKTP